MEKQEIYSAEKYVNTPQNDSQQIEQIAREYEAEKGIAHGLQKDAIQNGIGARLPGKEPDSYKKWSLKFKLFKIDKKFALSFTDEGTTGLTGSILSADEIEKLSEKELPPTEKLSRFLSRFNSGGNIGPGTFGRGKLIFQAASKSSGIICDSLRYDDKKYISFERKIVGTRLKQNEIPFVGDSAKEFIKKISRGILEPLSNPGTRITILDLKDEIVETIINSFQEDKPEIMNNHSFSFIKMIEETWWEILQKFNAKIFIEWDGRTKQIKLTDPLKSILEAKNNEERYKVYTKTLIPVVIKDKSYTIKELKLILCPHLLDDEMHGFWIQRKRMKIGYLKNIHPHHTIFKKICGYAILEDNLEKEIEKSENLTHYGFSSTGSISQIKQVFNNHLNRFQEELGIRVTIEEEGAQEDMRNALKDLDDHAPELGLLSSLFSGVKIKDIEIRIKSFTLPNKGSKRVEFGDIIGPIEYEIINNSNKKVQLEFILIAEQGKQNKTKTVYKKDIPLGPKKTENLVCPSFEITNGEFKNEEELIISAKIKDNSKEKKYTLSRKIWIGKDPPKEDIYFSVTAYSPLFPRTKSSRVEIGESIKNLRVKISNMSGSDIKINFDWNARKVPSESGDYTILENIKSEKKCILHALSDIELAYESLNVSGAKFILVGKGPRNSKERKCEIYFDARLSEHLPEFNMTKAQYLGKKSIPFYIGVDPPGNSIFKDMRSALNENDGRRSWYDGDAAYGYTFVLNEKHPSFIFTSDYPKEVRLEYIKEQMLCQAYAIAISEGKFFGVAEDFQEELTNQETSPHECFLKIYEIIGKAIIKNRDLT